MTITAEFWITCDICGHDTVMVSFDPMTAKLPANPTGAWRAAKTVGWTGSINKSVCLECEKKKATP